MPRYVNVAPAQCFKGKCGKCTRSVEYDDETDTTRVVFTLCQFARHAGIKMLNNEYGMYMVPWLEKP